MEHVLAIAQNASAGANVVSAAALVFLVVKITDLEKDVKEQSILGKRTLVRLNHLLGKMGEPPEDGD